jgi:hypothetical protein
MMAILVEEEITMSEGIRRVVGGGHHRVKPPVEAEWVCETGNEWSGTHIRFRLESRAPGTVVHFTHSGWASETGYFISCNTTWGKLMFRLKAAAEREPRGPLFLANELAY